MAESESLVIVIVLICLGVGLICTIVGLFLFNSTNWWDKW